jgi:hypothetical protein
MADSALLGTATTAPSRAVGTARPHPGPLLRVHAWLRRPWLDAAIARGLDRSGNAAFSLRRAQLAGARERTKLARRLEEILVAGPRRPAPSSAVPVDREAVEIARPLLTELILSLRSLEAVEPRGVVLGWRLLADPLSPLYAPERDFPRDPDRLWRHSLSVLLALRPSDGAPVAVLAAVPIAPTLT